MTVTIKNLKTAEFTALGKATAASDRAVDAAAKAIEAIAKNLLELSVDVSADLAKGDLRLPDKKPRGEVHTAGLETFMKGYYSPAQYKKIAGTNPAAAVNAFDRQIAKIKKAIETVKEGGDFAADEAAKKSADAKRSVNRTDSEYILKRLDEIKSKAQRAKGSDKTDLNDPVKTAALVADFIAQFKALQK